VRRRHIPVRHRPLGLERRAGLDQGGAFQCGVDQRDDLPRKLGQIRQGLVPDFIFTAFERQSRQRAQ